MSSISGSIYFSGLDGTGNNWAQTLEQLKQVESINLNRLEAWRSDWELRYMAFSKIIDAAKTARTSLGSLGDRNNFISKLVSSTKENVATATANASALDMQHTIKVKQVASNSVWANTGHKFTSKNDIINTSGTDQYFKYSYAGKEYSIKVPPNTTLDSFINLVNNSKDNPGIKASLIQTSGGYYFQIAGKETGEKNNLVIHSANLLGFDATGTNSIWETNKPSRGDASYTDPSNISYDFVLKNGQTKTITVKGDATLDDFVNTINSQLGAGTASIGANGNLELKNIQSVTRRDADNKDKDNQYKPESVRVEAGTYDQINSDYLISESSNETVTFTITMSDGSTRTITMKGNEKRSDFITKIAAATGNKPNMVLDESGKYYMDLAGVENITTSVTGGASLPSEIKFTQQAEKLPANDSLFKKFTNNASNYNLDLSFDPAYLNKKISNSDASLKKEYMIVKENGDAVTFTLKGDATYRELMEELKRHGFTADPSDPNKLKGAGIKSFSLIAGADPGTGYSQNLTCKNEVDFGELCPDGKPGAGDFKDAVLETPPDLKFKYQGNDGTEKDITLASGSSFKDIVAKLKSEGVDVELVYKDTDGTEKTLTDPSQIQDGTEYTLRIKNGTLSGPVLNGQVVQSDNWNIQKSCNAIYNVDNWPMDLESESNQITDVIEGLTINLHGVGETTLGVTTDVESIQESITKFVDTINELLATINTFTRYDENAKTTTNDPNAMDDPNYSMSQLTSQKGGLLQGNYGVQLFESRFMSVLTGTPPGYKSLSDPKDPQSGDILSCLANMGIKICSDENDENFGLLMIAPPAKVAEMTEMDKENYTKMISKNLDAVIDFFCGPEVAGTTDTSAFRYSSSLNGITQAGEYDVEYEVDAAGNIKNVTIGGVKASNDPSQGTNYYTVTSGPAKGTAIIIDDLSEGKHSGKLRIKQGLVDSVDQFLKAEMTYQDTGTSTNEDAMAIKAQNGGLMILQANYMDIMEGIDAKIKREQDRLTTWEKHQKAQFARLQTLLAQMNANQQQISGQLAQLGGGSGK